MRIAISRLAKGTRFRRGLIAALALSAVLMASGAVTVYYSSQESGAAAIGKMASLNKLQRAYLQWRKSHEQNGGDRNLVLRLGWSKAYSGPFIKASGTARLNLIDGEVSVEVEGLNEPADFWLIDNLPGEGRSAAPEAGDRMLKLGALSGRQGTVSLSSQVDDLFESFEVDLIAVARSGQDPVEGGLLFGSPTLFQRTYTRIRTGRMESSSSILTAVHASSLVPSFDPLIEKGADLFFNETFKGNGRTCGTCHPAENNLTIDPPFIATLRSNDALFVAEFVPALAQNFEKPELMRKVGLILENTNGFGDLENNFTMRGVPHTLGLPVSLTAPPGVTPAQMTGWSGDGAPNDGSLRQFAQGAITQHFPRTLNRTAGSDFRLATESELDAMEAFQLFLGRDVDLDLTTLNLRGEVPARGLEIFQTNDTSGGTVAAGKCGLCHFNAGALTSAGTNNNFNTGVEDLPDQPADLIDPANNPPDDGLGNPGDGSFNTPSLVEAADTGPFFHNNAIETIEEATNFYNSQAFANSPSGGFLASIDSGGIGIDLEATQVVAVAAFLRVINTLENIRSAEETTKFVRNIPSSGSPSERAALIRLALFEVEDGIEVLQCGNLHPDVVDKLIRAFNNLVFAFNSTSFSTRNFYLDGALNRLSQARDLLVY